MKAKRKALMAARLKKVRQHKLGQTADTSAEDKEEEEGEGQEEGQREEYVDKREGGVPPEAGKRHIRPWDRGKGELQQPYRVCVCTPHVPCPSPAVVGPERWRADLKEGREPEFAPPTSYFVKPKYTPQFFTSGEPFPSPTPQDEGGRPLLPCPSWTPAHSSVSAVDSLIADARAQQGH